MEETERRRTRQIEYNEAHGITPRTILKSVADILEGAGTIPGRKVGRGTKKVAEPAADYAVDAATLSPKELSKAITRLEDQMYEAAKNLEFEQAAKYRDELQKLKQHSFME